MNKTLEQVVHQLNLSWQAIEDAVNITYDDGYSALVWQLKSLQIQIENLETVIQEKEFEDE